MSRGRVIQRFRREIEFLDPGSFQRPSGPEIALDRERDRHRAELEAVRSASAAEVDRARRQAQGAVREEGARVRSLLERERVGAEELRREVARLAGSLRAARQEAAGHRMLRRELEGRLRAAEQARDAAADRARELLEIVRQFLGGLEDGKRVISLEERSRSVLPRR